jgi:hypothetical protein
LVRFLICQTPGKVVFFTLAEHLSSPHSNQEKRLLVPGKTILLRTSFFNSFKLW